MKIFTLITNGLLLAIGFGIGVKFGCNFLQPAPQTDLSPRSLITIVIIKPKMWPAAGCEAKFAAKNKQISNKTAQ